MIHQACTIGAGLLIVFGLYFALFGNEEFISWVSNSVVSEMDKLPSYSATSSPR